MQSYSISDLQSKIWITVCLLASLIRRLPFYLSSSLAPNQSSELASKHLMMQRLCEKLIFQHALFFPFFDAFRRLRCARCSLARSLSACISLARFDTDTKVLWRREEGRVLVSTTCGAVSGWQNTLLLLIKLGFMARCLRQQMKKRSFVRLFVCSIGCFRLPTTYCYRHKVSKACLAFFLLLHLAWPGLAWSLNERTNEPSRLLIVFIVFHD